MRPVLSAAMRVDRAEEGINHDVAAIGEVEEGGLGQVELFSETLAAEGAVVFAKAYELGLEGIVPKRQGSF